MFFFYVRIDNGGFEEWGSHVGGDETIVTWPQNLFFFHLFIYYFYALISNVGFEEGNHNGGSELGLDGVADKVGRKERKGRRLQVKSLYLTQSCCLCGCAWFQAV